MRLAKHKVVVLANYQKSLILLRGPLLTAMVEAGHQVVACAPEAEPSITAQLKAIGVDYQNLCLHRVGTNPGQDFLYLSQLRRFLSMKSPDALLAYTIKPVIYGSLAAQSAGVPRIFSMITGLGWTFAGNGPKRYLLRTAVLGLYRWALRYNCAVFFQNDHDMVYFKSHHLIAPWCRAILLNGSGIDLKEFAVAPWPADPCSFLLIARLIAEKGIREYVAAARLLKGRYPHVTFRLAGPFDPKPGSITAEEISQWQQAGIIEFLGWLDDVRPALRASSVYVLPSYYPEGIPHTILQALSMGRPIVTTAEPGCRQTVYEKVNGFLVPARSVGALAEAMERFIRCPSLVETMGRESRVLAESQYNVHQVNRIILETMDLAEPRSKRTEESPNWVAN